MSTADAHTPDDKAGRSQSRLAALVSLAAGLSILAMVLLYYLYFPARAGRPQPIPFSHRLHAGDKQISCYFCHSGAMRGDHAGVPPLQTCMLCHKRIITAYPAIEDLAAHFDAGVPVQWERINQIPDFVFFSHEVHIRKGFDCSACHGNVAEMDRTAAPHEFTMGFCVQCHRDNQASHDCTICHR